MEKVAKIHFDKEYKVALARVISDLIEADFIMDESEMNSFEALKDSKTGFGISTTMLAEAKRMKLSGAIDVLQELDEDGRRSVIQAMKKISLSDGTCVPQEAIFILAIEQVLEHGAQMFSVPASDVNIQNLSVIYIESEKHTAINEEIESNYRSISNEFAMGGFEFVHIPHIVRDYASMDEAYLEKVVGYMIPSVSKERTAVICKDLRSITTDRFCRDILSKKIGINLIDTKPALLIKMNESNVISDHKQDDALRTPFANFLKIELKGNVLESVRQVMDVYHSMINCSIHVESKPKSPRFLYYGFHRSLFDLIAFGRTTKEYKLFLDVNNKQEPVCLKAMDGSEDKIVLKLNPQQTALFMLIVKQSLNGPGLHWSERLDKKVKDKLLNAYNDIYRRLGKGNVTNEYKDRTHVHHIKKWIEGLTEVANADMFKPERVVDGEDSFYLVRVHEEYVSLKED